MKRSNFVLIFCLLGLFFSQDTEDQCETQFLSILQERCSAGACTFNKFDKQCISTNECSGTTIDACEKNIPVEFHKKKCSFDSTCKTVDKVCSDFNIVGKGSNKIYIQGDTCSDLAKVEGEGDRCYYSLKDISTSTTQRECKTHYDSCSSINQLAVGNKDNICKKNIPKELTNMCVWNSDTLECEEKPRTCAEYQYLYNWASTDTCKTLISSSTNSLCAYNGRTCEEAFPCEHWNDDAATCNSKTPINEDKTGFDYLYRCKYDSTITTGNKCKKVKKKCNEYNDFVHGDTLCSQFEAEDSEKKKCVLKGTCTEQYKDCQTYNDNEKEKSRAACESLILDGENKKCVYIKEEHKCQEGNIYNNCNEYKGSDKKICENILSPKRNSYCVLDKDSVCKEREFYCPEAHDRYECLIYAKPTDNNKKCIWDVDDKICIEQYKGCEDYVKKRLGTSNQDICDALEVYNGKKCVYDSDKCTSIDKECGDAKSEEECKLIEKTGVSDPERKYCEWVSTGDCIENYKYCSDYRQTVSISDTTYEDNCKKIKPFDPETNTLDLAYTCVVKDFGVGCEKVPKECNDADSNKILCDLISPIIKDNRVKYCAFVNGVCEEHYKSCEIIDNEIIQREGSNTICSNNIPQDEYFAGTCETYIDSTDGKTKCQRSGKKCDAFNNHINDLNWLCSTINPNCTYSYSDRKCKTDVKTCGQIKFYKESDDNKAICEGYITTDVDKVCVLNEDKSGCKEVYRESIPFIYANNINQENNSAFKSKLEKMYCILALLSLLL